MDITYNRGFANHFSSEAWPNALPHNQNTPQNVPYGLYTEQLSGTAFTLPRHQNRRSWLYRRLPSVGHNDFLAYAQPLLTEQTLTTPPTQFRWDPLPLPNHNVPTEFLASLITVALSGTSHSQTGGAIHLYACNQPMTDYFYNADGEWLLIPQIGELTIATELGLLKVAPAEIAVLPRGIKFRIIELSEPARGTICENFGMPFTLPDLGPIGANGLANPRDFYVPIAWIEPNAEKPCQLIAKFGGQLWQTDLPVSPLNVVAWHGNYAPYKYALHNFNTINTVSYDHPDPSIFTVLSAPSHPPGLANIDFVIFPPRWLVAEHTFRPPYFHRNVMSEYMGLISGQYDAKVHGFSPGGASLHNCMSAHGPDSQSYQAAVTQTLQPTYYDNTLAFMLECRFVWQLTAWAWQTPLRQQNYLQCWQGFQHTILHSSNSSS